MHRMARTDNARAKCGQTDASHSGIREGGIEKERSRWVLLSKL